jgi:UDP-N-acetylglucosamine--N-acetylmuramyl-(pentapeptide) pyrophosphoryl-undecaprenol N-acetylglucosamine transferase
VTTYLLAGGGTAGHVNPMLAVADGLRERNPEDTVLILGTAEGLESRLVPERGYELLIVPKVPFPRRLNAAAVAFPARYAAAVKTVRRYIRDRGVDVVLGVGGYASAPAYSAAKKERIPSVVHEANARPGMANVLGARSAAAVGVAFDGTPLRRGEFVGMPLRPEIVNLDRARLRAEAARHFGLDASRPVLLVFGGSLGARRINGTLAESWQDIVAAGWQILHATGEKNDTPESTDPGYVAVPYLNRMDLAFALADVIVARSGSPRSTCRIPSATANSASTPRPRSRPEPRASSTMPTSRAITCAPRSCRSSPIERPPPRWPRPPRAWARVAAPRTSWRTSIAPSRRTADDRPRPHRSDPR